MPGFKIKQAFTLAEVLITLTIIGVIASLTIPSLINNVNKAQYVVALQKNYAMLQQAFLMLKTENGGSIIPVFENDTHLSIRHGNGTALNMFLTKLNYVKNCGNEKGCWYDTPLYKLDGTTNANLAYDTNMDGAHEKAILANGTMIKLSAYTRDCTNDWGNGPLDGNACAEIYIDVNGAKGPNTIGRDYFGFSITRTGIYPKGSFGDIHSCEPDSGTGCAFKVLKEGAMNY